MRASRPIVTRLRLLALSLVAGLLAAAPAEAERARFYTNDQLHLLFAGSKVVATGDICGEVGYDTGLIATLTFSFDPAGTFSVDHECVGIQNTNVVFGEDTGKWWIEDNTLCLKFNSPEVSTRYRPNDDQCWVIGHGKYRFGLYLGSRPFWKLEVTHPKFTSKEKLLAALDAVAEQSASGLSADLAAMPPAEYKPLPAGTRVRYDNWSFTVTRSDGFETVIRDNKNRRYAQFYAVFGRQGSDLYTFHSNSFSACCISTWESSFSDETKSRLKSVWPLSVGKKVELKFEETYESSQSTGTRPWRVTLEVVGTEILDIGDKWYPTFVIRSHASSDNPRVQAVTTMDEEYTETYWYNPGSGLVLKFERQWIRGEPLGANDRYELVGIRYPEGTTTHALKGTKPAGEADQELLAEVERLKGEAAEAREAEAARKAEIARLRREAADARRAVESRKAREAEEEEAREGLIAKLRQELDDRRAAEEARKAKEAADEKAREAEIAELRRGAEAARHAAEARKAQEAADEKAREAELARLRQAVEERRQNEAALTAQESEELQARLKEIEQLKHAADARRKAEEARKAREAEAEKIRAQEIARLRDEAEAAKKAVATRAAAEAEEKEARAAEIARLRKDAEDARKAVEARKAREAEKEQARIAEMARLKQARAADVARLKQEIEERRKAEEARKAKEAEEEKIRLAEIAALKKDIEARRKREAEAAKRREAEIARFQRQAEEARKTRETEIAKLRRELEAAREAQEAEREQAPGGVEGIEFGRYHALVIGIDRYKYLPKLKTAVNDAKVIARVLIEEYGFRVRLMTNPDHAEIIDALDEYRETLGPKDNLLIYYAGHGWLDQEADRGYWLPANAKPKRRSRWVSNATVTDTLKTLSAKHVMIVADSCYSGTLVRGTDVGIRNRGGDYWRQMAEKWARVAITSGGLEPVADQGGGGHSPFAKAFIDALTVNNAVMDGTQLFSKMRRPVMVAAKQTPQYADVRQAGHDGGDFLFVRK